MKQVLLALVSALAFGVSPVDVRGQTGAPPTDVRVRELLQQLEQAMQSGQTTRYLSLLSESADRTAARDFADSEIAPGVTRVVIQERDREPLLGTLPGNGYRLLVDAFIESRARARVVTWRIDIRRPSDADPWRIVEQERLTGVENLYRLSLNPGKQYDARNLTIAAPDLEFTLPAGSVFVAETDQGVTGLVLLGRGDMRFHPAPATEKTQLKIFCGSETLDTHFDALFIRVNPADFEQRIPPDRLTPRAVDAGAFRRADDLFREQAPKSFTLDLADLSRDTWSLLPGGGDFVADIRTRRFGTLTYARSGSEAEDITLFDRKRHRNIALYASEQKLARRGPFYNEDDLADYDVLDYNIDLAYVPEREWLEGRARLRVKVRAFAAGTLTLKLAEPLVVQSIVSDRFGRLFGVRVRNQNSIVVNLPSIVTRDTELTLTVTYAGRLEPQTPDRETLQGRQASQDEAIFIPPEPSYLYSNNSFWYPQSGVTDYATATIRLTIPAGLECIASGDLAAGSPTTIPAKDGAPARRAYLFIATQPVRYLAFIVSHFARTETVTIALPRDTRASDGADMPPMAGASFDSLNLAVETNPRQTSRGRDVALRATDIAQFYASLVDDCPYPSLTVALVESTRPGGHSPAYFAAINQLLPAVSGAAWRNDPEVFNNYPEFYLAHEIAHQWWGQAVGWRNYHEQWLSEGFAQYFAALYAQRFRGDDAFASVLRQLRKWGIDESPAGPIYLGYRLGHIQGEPRVRSALMYNKSAAVLHMLRRLIGDDQFFRGVKRFYRGSRFRKAGTEDLRLAMEAESKRSLERFFQRWIYGSTLPQLKFSHRVEGHDIVLHVEQIGELFDVPLTVTLQYADKKPVDVLVPVTERAIDMRVALAGTLRGVQISKDDGTMAVITRDRD